LIALVSACGGTDDDGEVAQGSENKDQNAAASECTDGGFDGTLRLGALLDLSSSVAPVGRTAREGMEFAVAQYSDDPGVGEIDLVVEDHGGDRVVAVSKAQSLINSEDVSALIGMNQSQVSLALAPIVDRERVPAVTDLVVDPEFAAASEYTFLGKPPTSDLVAGFFEGAGAELGTKAAILYNGEVPSVGSLLPAWKEGLEAAGIDVVAELSHQLSTTDFQGNISTALRDDPDVLIALDITDKSAQIFKQARELGFEGTFSGLSVIFHPQTLSIAGTAAEGLTFPAGWHPDSDRGTSQEFVAAFAEAHNGDVPQLAHLDGYMSAATVIEAAIAACSTDREAIREGLQSLDIDTPYGNFTFDEDGVPQVEGVVVTVRDGEFVIA